MCVLCTDVALRHLIGREAQSSNGTGINLEGHCSHTVHLSGRGWHRSIMVLALVGSSATDGARRQVHVGQLLAKFVAIRVHVCLLMFVK